MTDDNDSRDEEIIHAAYAERVRDAFKIFAENLGMGENEKSLKERFARAIDMTRKARDLALQAVTGVNIAESDAPAQATSKANAALSMEEQAIIDQAISGTTGHRAAPPPQPMGRFGR